MNGYEMIDGHEMAGYDDCCLVAGSDFSRLMKEARRNRGKARQHGSEATQCLDKEMKSKKTWKKSLSSWWRSFKKSDIRGDSGLDSSYTPCNSKIGEDNISYLTYQSTAKITKHSRLPKSGSVVMDLFAPTKGFETEMPYAALSQSPDDSGPKPYGPVYFVT